MQKSIFTFDQAAPLKRTPGRSALSRAMLVCATVLVTGQIGSAQSPQINRDDLPPLVSSHGSTGRLDPDAANTQAMARERADALEGRIEEPVMTPTRSSFLAKWSAVAGASGYRLDISTSPSFDSYVKGYRDRDIGNVTSHIVSELTLGTQYYYRVRAYDAAGMGSGNSETMPAATANTSSGLVIIPSFDSTITSDPRSNAIQAMITSAIQAYQTLFTDPITVTILFRLSTVHADGTPLHENLVASSDTTSYPRDWNMYINALKADAKTASDVAAIATLPSSALTASIVMKSANGRAIGLNTAPAFFADGHLGVGGPYDGIITLNPAKPLQFTRPVAEGNCDARTFTEHEIDEVLGLGSHIGGAAPQFLEPEDLFTWSSLNARNTDSTGERHFSIDRGLHFIVTLNRDPAGDFGDWESEPQCPQNHPLVQNAFNCPGQSPEISTTSPEAISLDVIGYDLVDGSSNNGVLGNISTRLPVGTGNNILIAGFQITGDATKQLLVRALGPSLAQFGLSNVLPDTTLELHDSTGALIATNDDWQDAANAQSIPAALRPSSGLESAILTTLSRGAYTAVLRGFNNSTGIGLVEVYDTSAGSTQLGNISTRGFVQTGDNVMIAGLVVQSHSKPVVIRALGPTLTAFGINNALPDPTLSLYDANGGLLIFNDDWKDSQESIISSTGLAPSNDLESAIAGTVAPGSYTAVVRGFENATGNALIEVYRVN